MEACEGGQRQEAEVRNETWIRASGQHLRACTTFGLAHILCCLHTQSGAGRTQSSVIRRHTK